MDQQTTEQLPSWDLQSKDGAFSLLVVCGGVTSTYPLSGSGQVLIGRARHAAVRIDHGSVSREHALLQLGEQIQIQDLDSANGTRVQGRSLSPREPVTIAPNEVIDLGEVLLVVQPRRLEERRGGVCAPAFFELRLEEECERARANGRGVAVARLHVQGELGTRAVQLLLASELGVGDLVCSPRTNEHELLLLETERHVAEQRLARLGELLGARGLLVHATLAMQPGDGDDARSLLGRPLPPPSRAASYGELVVEDPAMRRVCRLLERVAPSELGVILLGETGVGKEMCAELLHRASPRAAKRLLRLSCAALPETLLESELFGYERGAFTGAISDKIGLLESASGGSVFLDEVGDMPLATQVKLLRVLEAKEVLRIGSRSPRPLDVRVIAATNRDLQERITAGLFREDLFYRLNGISVLVPPLRERPADIAPLARHFVARQPSGAARPELSEAALEFLRAQRWPGNVRELKNAMERAAVLCDGPHIEPALLRGLMAPAGAASGAEPEGLRAEVEALERQRIEGALREAGGSQRRAAARLGISRGALLRRLQQYGLSAPRKES